MSVDRQHEWSDDDDEADNLSSILKKLKNKNLSVIEDFGNTEQYLLNTFNKESNVCLICIESINANDAIWSCKCCFVHFHINCIQSWIKDGSYLTSVSQSNGQNLKIPWNCPKCRQEYDQSKYPTSYFCYCGKQKNPEYDPWIIPHSCNQRCDKEKSCGHLCLMLCHPGPCPPCPKMVSNSCYCNKSTATSRRCSNKYWSCNKECMRLLVCKQHTCKRICHPDSCGECKKTSVQNCICKKYKKEVSCTSTIWKCDDVCGKIYSCGSHKCEVICHKEGECGVCPRSIARTCPCGKSKSKKPCTEDIPTCGDTCDKLLDCGLHRCVRQCHRGPCDTCRQLVIKKCRCGIHKKELPCCVQFTCETKCAEIRNCGKHKCNKKCCDGQHLPCEQICNKQLACKHHKCNMLCHKGRCYPCPILVDIYCTCSASKTKVPCAKSKDPIKVSCRQLCKKPPDCHHTERKPHRCHNYNTNPCPPCSFKCDKVMKCQHTCQQTCHGAVMTEIVEKKVREGPWVPIKVEKKIMNLECPPCTVRVNVECIGKHEITDWPCHNAKPYSCGRKCGNLLKCTHHKCEYECHEIIMENNVSINCQECERDCEQPRPKGCVHTCSNVICHINKCKPCIQLLRFKCHCGNNNVYVECQKWFESNLKTQNEMKSCKVPCTKNIECGHQCSLLCHQGECSKRQTCIEKVLVKCECKTLKKHLICNQINSNNTIIECNEKCNLKKKSKMDSNFNTNKTNDEYNKYEIHKKQNSLRFSLILGAILVFIISYLIIIFIM